MKDSIKANAAWLIPVLAMAAITPFSPALDLKIARAFYTAAPSGDFSQSQVLKLIYVYGLVPGQITVVLAAIGLLFSFLSSKCRSWRPYTLYLVLTLAIGSGLISHAVFKDHWGRPRPRQVAEFGGDQVFRPYYKPNFFDQPEPSKSFPCGHCTMGFYFFAFAILGRRTGKKWLHFSGLVLSIVLGGALAYARMAQGGHFFSDVLMAGLIMWLTAFVLDRIIFEDGL